MKLKIVTYGKLPEWAKHVKHSKNGLYIIARYSPVHAITCPFSLNNLIRVSKNFRKSKSK